MAAVEDILYNGILGHDRSVLAKAITLIESTADKDIKAAGNLLPRILPYSGHSIRLAVSGPPGAGKSTLIEKLGLYLIGQNHKIAVLAIDPSSTKSGGSILGDKTRMENLARSPDSFIRPSPSLGKTGGVAAKTRETILLCEAAGYDIIIIETMGVGQGELAVYNMVDFFLLVQIAGSGDELQGMKKGIVEVADSIVINKADGENIAEAEKARQQIEMALHYLSTSADWKVPVITSSASENRGIDKIWSIISDFISRQKLNQAFEKKRSGQNRDWMLSLIRNQMEGILFSDKTINQHMEKLEQQVLNDEILATSAAEQIIELFKERYKS